MALLLLASVTSWFMIVQRFLYFRSASAEMLDFEEHFWSGVDLSQLYREGDNDSATGMESIFRAGFKEERFLIKFTQWPDVRQQDRVTAQMIHQSGPQLTRSPPGGHKNCRLRKFKWITRICRTFNI